jgi:hypothetical protein
VPILGPILARKSLLLLGDAQATAADASLSARLTHLTLMRAAGDAANLPPDTALAGSNTVTAVLAASVSGSVRQGLRLAAAAGEWHTALAAARARAAAGASVASLKLPAAPPPATAAEATAEERHELIVRRYLLKQLSDADAARRVRATRATAVAAAAEKAAAEAAAARAQAAARSASGRLAGLLAATAPGRGAMLTAALEPAELLDAERAAEEAQRGAVDAEARLAGAAAAERAAQRDLERAAAAAAASSASKKLGWSSKRGDSTTAGGEGGLNLSPRGLGVSSKDIFSAAPTFGMGV